MAKAKGSQEEIELTGAIFPDPSVRDNVVGLRLEPPDPFFPFKFLEVNVHSQPPQAIAFVSAAILKGTKVRIRFKPTKGRQFAKLIVSGLEYECLLFQ